MSATRSIILAAGKGSRMNSDLAKVLHALNGRPMILYSVETARLVTGQPPVLVIGHQADEVRAVVGSQAEYVFQDRQLGTAHAVQQAERALSGHADRLLVTSGDMPLFTTDTLSALVKRQEANSGPLSMLTVTVDDPRGFGRIVRGRDGRVKAVVEEAVATPEQLAIRELNVGAYCVAGDWLWEALRRIPVSPVGEYYLTDLVEVAVRQGLRVEAIAVTDPREAIGINTLQHLAEAEQMLAERLQSSSAGLEKS